MRTSATRMVACVRADTLGVESCLCRYFARCDGLRSVDEVCIYIHGSDRVAHLIDIEPLFVFGVETLKNPPDNADSWHRPNRSCPSRACI